MVIQLDLGTMLEDSTEGDFRGSGSLPLWE
jgi:hypothetical protein